ncbi:LexA repressor [Roseivivax marinus]|uniref:LexA repressor n=1 Tax=Roseivivax marinus TaxID=1379903 RepID=W4HGG2_9RHOB|nr:hypothetical protein [Roseivivax marinus]ETW11080.1 LexA repressor [Roseivivax marinus]
MSGYGLTVRQSEALDFISSHLNGGRCPSFDEIRVALGLGSKGSVHRIVDALGERGHLVRLHGRARSLALPETIANAFSEADRVHVLSIARRGIDRCPSEALREIITALDPPA